MRQEGGDKSEKGEDGAIKNKQKKNAHDVPRFVLEPKSMSTYIQFFYFSDEVKSLVIKQFIHFKSIGLLSFFLALATEIV